MEAPAVTDNAVQILKKYCLDEVIYYIDDVFFAGLLLESNDLPHNLDVFIIYISYESK